MTNAPRPIPRDGRLISLILASKGVEDADERVIHQLLDFSHRYTADVLRSAQTLADHASRGGAVVPRIEKDDIELAVQMRKRYEFFEAPPRDYLADMAHELNSQPLPALPESFDILRLPPPHQRITDVNFDLLPDQSLEFDSIRRREDDEDESESSEDDEDEVHTDDGHGANGNGNGNGHGEVVEDDAEGEDEDMEEVGVGAVEPEPEAVRQDREMDEDYDA